MSKGGEGMSEQSGSVLVDHYSSSEKYVGRGKKRAWISCKDETWPKIETFSSVEFFFFFFKYATDTLFLKEHGLLDLQFVILLGITIISRACLAPKVCGFRAGSAHPEPQSSGLVVWKFRLPSILTSFHQNCGQFGLAMPQAQNICSCWRRTESGRSPGDPGQA